MLNKKTISVLVPCFNEEENVVPMRDALISLFKNELINYNYEIVYIDNCSTDNTRSLIREMCKNDKNIKAIFNSRNFGQFNSPFHGIINTTGDCTVGIACDFQDPVELIPEFVKAWEEGYKVVIGIKKQTSGNKIMHGLRALYYKALRKMSEIEIIEQYSGFSLFDKQFVSELKKLKDPTPFFRGMVAELGFSRKEIEYVQPERRAGKTHNNFFTLYDAAMLSFTSYTKVGLRLCTFVGVFVAFVSFLIGLIYLVLKCLYWYEFSAGTAPVLIGMFMLGAVQLIFLGLIGEYTMSINQRVMNRPIVVEEERINFKDERNKE